MHQASAAGMHLPLEQGRGCLLVRALPRNLLLDPLHFIAQRCQPEIALMGYQFDEAVN